MFSPQGSKDTGEGAQHIDIFTSNSSVLFTAPQGSVHNMICDTDPFMDTDMKQQITVGMGSHGIRQSQAWQEQAGVSRYIVTAVVAILYSKCIGPIVNQVLVPLSMIHV